MTELTRTQLRRRAYYAANRDRERELGRAWRAARRAELGPPKKPGRKCFTCASEFRARVDEALFAGETVVSVATRFGLGYASVKRHRRARHHLQHQEGTQHD